MVISVLVEINIDKVFDYNVPDNLKENICLGKRVLVPFGKQVLEGFIIDIKNKSNYELKDIISIVDNESILNDELLSLGKEISKSNVCNLTSVYQSMLPVGLKASKNRKVSIRKNTYIRLISDDVIEFISNTRSLKQKEIVSYLLKNKNALTTTFDSSSINALIKKGIIEKYSEEYYRLNDNNSIEDLVTLNEYQIKAYNEIKESSKDVILLNGVTGSGKTEIYMHLIKDALDNKKSAILLVPEISLTPQIIGRFKKHFNNIAVLHSGLSQGEKYDEYRKILNKEVNIVIGARSAIFAPLNDLGVIIIDEEHSQTYKQDHNPRYNAIDVAIMRGKTHNCKVILGSATPMVEDYARAKKGYYELVKLDKRANNASMPIVNIVDMTKETKKGNKIFSEELLLSIEDRLNKHEQIMLLLNKRGYSNYLMCPNCGEVKKCPNCDITLTYHKTSNMNRCHYCGYADNNKEICSKCNTKLVNMGLGTEKVEEEINKLFPDAKVLRMDIDTTGNKGSHQKIIDKFMNHEADILVGTQMISKGLDFPLVTLVGVINADTILNLPDFRSSERTYDLISQVSGRAGRSNLKGKVVIQTYNPDNYAIKLVSSNNYEDFYNEEITIRKKLYYPPYSFIALIKVGGKDFNSTIKEANKIGDYLRRNVDKEIVLGPSVASLSKINNIYYFEIIIKYRDKDNIVNILNDVRKITLSNSKINVQFDINPISL